MKKLKFIEVKSEIGAGTRGASLGIDAIKIAAGMAKLDKYKTISLPEHKDFLERIMENISAETKKDAIKSELGDAYPYYKQVKEILNMRGMQARLPVDIIIE